ncbi:MAG: ABC transporter permease [Candidatus Latescibacterota bacterium]
MGLIEEGIEKGIGLIFAFDREVFSILGLTLFVCVASTVIAVCIGVPFGALIATQKFPLKKVLITLINTGMGLPPVVVGLAVSLMLFRNGPLGALEWLYTVKGMILAQVIIATPVVMGLTIASLQGMETGVYRQILSLGANRTQALYLMLREARLSILAAVIAGFGSVISEVGAVMMVGGNIKGQTRVLTTDIVLQTQAGNFAMAIALGLILLTLSFSVNLALTFIQQNRAN